MKSTRSLIAALALAFPVAAQTCKMYDADNNEIWSGPCPGAVGAYDDTCNESYTPPNCPKVPCSGGVPGEVQNGVKCLQGTGKRYSAGGVLEEERLICYCEVPGTFGANAALSALGFIFGLGVLRRRRI